MNVSGSLLGMENTSTHQAVTLTGVTWTHNGRRATFESSRPGYGVQVIATGEFLSSNGRTPSAWRSKDAAQMVADHPMDWPTIRVL